VAETDLGRVPDLVRSLLGDPGRLATMGAAMRRVARLDAAERIAEELIALARG
jgi:UDP-N-acetylglucosamine:LPS N-acetylglucosamine transferase